MKNETFIGLGFHSQLGKNKDLPIETNAQWAVFIENSLEFGLSAGDSIKKWEDSKSRT